MSYTSFFLNAAGSAAPIDCIHISHPTFEFFFQSFDEDGFTITHEDGARAGYEYMPMQIDGMNVNSDLDQIVKMTINDFDDQLIRKYESLTDNDPVLFRRRIYRDDNLDYPMITIQVLHIVSMSKDSKGNVTFEAKAPELNSNKTGKTYTNEDFPMMRRM